jgi:aerotaxis receptor
MLTSYQAFIETQVPEGELIVSRTNLKGVITYANDVFAEISGYSAEELVGQHHNIVRHPDMPRSVFANLWESIKSGKIWSGYVKNLRRDGGYYWVYAEVSGVYKDGELVEYKSMRSPVASSVKILFQDKYDALRAREEKEVRAVINLSVDLVEKIKKLAREENKKEDRVINELLEDSLF